MLNFTRQVTGLQKTLLKYYYYNYNFESLFLFGDKENVFKINPVNNNPKHYNANIK